MGIIERYFRPLAIMVESSFKATTRFWTQWRRNGRPSSVIINRQVRCGLYQLPERAFEDIND